MKKSIFLSIFISFIISGNAQTIFAPTGATWYFSGEEQLTAGFGTRYIKYEAMYDTLIQTKICKKIISTIYNYHQGPPANNDTVSGNTEYTYTSNDTVYYFSTEYNRFFSLYYFNVIPNDTLVYHIPTSTFSSPDSIFHVIVDSVTFVTVSGYSLKRVWTSPIDDFHIPFSYIERMGADYSFGLIGHEYRWSVPTIKGLRCYSDSSISYNFEPITCDYLITTSLINLEKNYEPIIYPNPTNTNLNVKITSNEIPEYYQIMDITGKIICTEKIVSNNFTISTENLTPSVYNLYVFSKNKPASNKRFSVIK